MPGIAYFVKRHFEVKTPPVGFQSNRSVRSSTLSKTRFSPVLEI